MPHNIYIYINIDHGGTKTILGPAGARSTPAGKTKNNPSQDLVIDMNAIVTDLLNNLLPKK